MKLKLAVEIEWDMPEQLDEGMDAASVINYAQNLVDNACGMLMTTDEFSNYGAKTTVYNVRIDGIER